MGFYDVPTLTKSKVVHQGEKVFMKHYSAAYGTEGFSVTVDDMYKDIPMILKKHTNPLNKNKHDMKAKYLNSTGDFMHLGNIITIPQNGVGYKYYMAITEPSSNGVYSEYKILPLTDDIRFNLDMPVNMKCIIADKGLYDEVSYINEQNVFEDKDLRAAIVQYNDNTKQLNLFDDVYINDSNYRIVKIDNYTLKEYDEEFGVLQLVLVDTPFGTIVRNEDSTPIKGVIMTARVKDKILNSISRELLCEHNKVMRGDYIYFTYDRDKLGTMLTETYLTVNKPSMGDKYDVSLMYLCEYNVNLLNDRGEVVKIPLYFEDNRTRIDKEADGENLRFRNSSYLATIQKNDITSKLKYSVNRIMVDGDVYRITGHDDKSSKGLIDLGLEIDQITPDDNTELGVANYKSQMDKINGSGTPTGSIKGDDELYLGYPNEYVLEMPNACIWSVDNPNVTLTDLGNNKCEILCDKISELNKTIILSAKIGDFSIDKSIKIVM